MPDPKLASTPNGFLNLDKPGGMTSRDVVDLISRPLRKVKVGHAGTLDPLASGVLVVAVGGATRLIEMVQRMPKSYRAVVRLGATSDTLDADGQVTPTPDAADRVPTEAAVRAALATQVGTIDQMPPQFSALKVAGRRAYDLARAGEEAALAARPVRIDRVELIRYAWPELEIAVDCGSGTYIRSIARDVGDALGVGGLIDVLVRTRIGPFAQAEAIDPVGVPLADLLARLRPPGDALGDLPRLTLDAEQVRRAAGGSALDPARVPGAPGLPPGEVGLLGPDGALVALAEILPTGLIQPRKVLG